MPSDATIVDVLLSRYGQTFSDQLEIDVARNTPTPLFQLLVAALLFSARIKSSIAVAAARALFAEGWTTAHKLKSSIWGQRVAVLNGAGYARYDESTASMLDTMSDKLITDYGGDLRRLRSAAKHSPQSERSLLTGFKGVGPAGADIFLREAQAAWDELYPYADKKVLQAAGRLGLPTETEELAKLVPEKDFARLAAALVRVNLSDGYDEVTKLAVQGGE